MSAESQSEDIWQYAMRPTPDDGDVRNAPLTVAHESSGGGGGGTATSTDLSDELGSFPRHFNLHGLPEIQTQSQGPWLISEASMDLTESQKENIHLSIPSGSPSSPLLSAALAPPISHSADTKGTMPMAATSSNRPAQSSHVTPHVMSASTRAPATPPLAGPRNAPAPSPLGSSSLMKDGKEPLVRATPLKHKSKTVSFLSPTAPPSPPTVPRIKTMPPRLNRYAPRDIDPSSQDSFAGPLPPQDLSTFARHSSILNNTFIRTTRDGELGDVFQRRTHKSSTSLSESHQPDDMASISQSEQLDDDLEPTPSQVMRLAFDPRLSPQREPQPVVLAKDSQSDQHSQDSEASAIIHSLDRSSSSASYHLPVPGDEIVATQPNTQPNTQPTQPNTQSDILLPSSVGNTSGGPSPLPVPPHRRRELAALQAARMRDRDEVIPETPQSTSGPSAHASAVLPPHDKESATGNVETQYDEIPKNPPPRSKDARRDDKGKGKEIVPEVHDIPATRPVSKGKGKAKEQDVQVEADSPARMTRSAAGKSKPDVTPASPKVKPRAPVSIRPGRPRESEVIPDSQEEEQPPLPPPPSPPKPHSTTRRGRPRESEIVPDSQEEEERQTSPGVPPSSPAVPLKDVSLHRSAGVPPTPTPAAVKSPLRKGQLPEGVTHTRGRGRAISAKGKRKAKEMEESEEEGVENDEVVKPLQEDAEEMDVDEDQEDVDEPVVPVSKGKRPAAGRSIKKEKKIPAPKKQKKHSRKTRIKAAAATTPVEGPSTRLRMRKSEAPADSLDDNEGPSTDPAPEEKRQRKSKAVTPVLAPVPISTRVFARRADKKDHYLPGTVTAMASPADPSPAPTSTVFRVDFDDGREEDVDVQFMRQFELQMWDVVHVTRRIKNKNRVIEAEVLVVEHWAESEVVDVRDLGSGPDGDEFETEGRLVTISEAQIREEWNERRVSVRTLRGDQAFQDFPIPKANERLSGFGFVITVPDLPRSKRRIEKLIEASGGVVFEDWTGVVTLGGTVETAGKRMSGSAKMLRVRKGVPEQLFCLTEEPSTTPKYLVALALGVPCISMEWVLGRVLQDESKAQVDWPAYVLPAGYNPATRLPASQAFDRAWWRESGQVANLISDPPIFKPFLEKSFLCVGTKQFLFTQKQLGTFPRVLLAMGASYVEAVTDLDRAKKRSAGFNYTVVDDGEPLVTYPNALAVDVSWIKKCLVTGVEGPVPWLDSA